MLKFISIYLLGLILILPKENLSKTQYIPPHVKVTFNVAFWIINNINFCVCNGAAYHNAL